MEKLWQTTAKQMDIMLLSGMEIDKHYRKTLMDFKQMMYSSMPHTSIQSKKCITGTPQAPSRLLCASSMFMQLILTNKDLLHSSKLQTIAIVGRPHKKAQWSFPISYKTVFWMRSYAEVRLILSRTGSMTINKKKNIRTVMHLWRHLMKKNKKAVILKMRMIKR